jgi:hypothetical protein
MVEELMQVTEEMARMGGILGIGLHLLLWGRGLRSQKLRLKPRISRMGTDKQSLPEERLFTLGQETKKGRSKTLPYLLLGALPRFAASGGPWWLESPNRG